MARGARRRQAGDELATGLEALSGTSRFWRTVELASGDHVFRRGDAGDALYVVEDGELEAYAVGPGEERLVLERILPGDHFGELALVDGGPRTASVVCLTDCRLRLLRREDVARSFADRPELVGPMVETLVGRMRRTVSYLECVAEWAQLVAGGRYAEARAAIERDASSASDANLRRFASAFSGMVAAVQRREDALLKELTQLRIHINPEERQQSLAEITETDFFRSLEDQARLVRERRSTR